MSPVFLSLIACGLITAHEQFLIYAVVGILEENINYNSLYADSSFI